LNSTTRGPHAYGIPKYMAPELLALQPRNSTSDTFALGCVFIELLFAGVSTQPVDVGIFVEAIQHLHTRLRSIQHVQPHGPLLVDHIIDMTAHDPRQRPAASTLATAICRERGFCCEQCLPARNESEPYWIWSAEHKQHYHREVDSYGTLSIALAHLLYKRTDSVIGRPSYTWSP
jgi:serine/threonine protein kinase